MLGAPRVVAPPSAPSDPDGRLAVGLAVGRRTGRVKVALLHLAGDGPDLEIRGIDARIETPAEHVDPVELAAELMSGLAESAGRSVTEIDVAGVSLDAALVFHDLAAHRLVERTGVTLIHRFDLADRGAGGLGGPLTPVPDWFLFRSRRSTRLLVHLGRWLRLALLPAGAGPDRTFATDLGPGCALLDDLVRELSRGKFPFDPGGRFAVQGRLRPELLEAWRCHPFLQRPIPKFLTAQESAESFTRESIDRARRLRIPAADTLRSACELIVELLAEGIAPLVASENPTDPAEVLASGGGLRHGLLCKLMADRLPGRRTRRIDDLGVPTEVRAAVHAAVLATLRLDGVSGNIPELSGAAGPRVLGQIIPGRGAHWSRWLDTALDQQEPDVKRAAA
jgi:anhydro-N-acetylmuramic acid kinase